MSSVRALNTSLQGSCFQRVLTCRGIKLGRAAACEHCVAISHKGQLIPVRPLARRDLRFHAAVVESALLHGITAADIHAHMSVILGSSGSVSMVSQALLLLFA